MAASPGMTRKRPGYGRWPRPLAERAFRGLHARAEESGRAFASLRAASALRHRASSARGAEECGADGRAAGAWRRAPGPSRQAPPGGGFALERPEAPGGDPALRPACSRRTAVCRRGSGTTWAFRGRAADRWEPRVGTAVSFDSTRTGSSPSASPWPTSASSCRSPPRSICRSSRRSLGSGERRRVSPTTSPSVRSSRSPRPGFEPQSRTRFPAGFSWPRPDTAAARPSVTTSRRSASDTSSESRLRRPPGLSGRGTCACPCRFRQRAPPQASLSRRGPSADLRRGVRAENRARAFSIRDLSPGNESPLTSHLHAVRVRPAPRDDCRAVARPEERPLIEWPSGQKEPAESFLSTPPPGTPLATLVRTAKLRWRIERDDEGRDDGIGPDHDEGCGSRGFYHHATLCMAIFGLVAVGRGLSSPSGVSLLGLPFRVAAVPAASARGVLPIRPQRRVPESIETMRVRIALVFLEGVPRCPCCPRAVTDRAPARTRPPPLLTPSYETPSCVDGDDT